MKDESTKCSVGWKGRVKYGLTMACKKILAWRYPYTGMDEWMGWKEVVALSCTGDLATSSHCCMILSVKTFFIVGSLLWLSLSAYFSHLPRTCKDIYLDPSLLTAPFATDATPSVILLSYYYYTVPGPTFAVHFSTLLEKLTPVLTIPCSIAARTFRYSRCCHRS